MAEPTNSSIALIIGISVTSALVFLLLVVIILLVLRYQKYKKGRNLEHEFVVHGENNVPVYTVGVNRTTYQPVPPPLDLREHPMRPENILYAEPRISTASNRTSSLYATIPEFSADRDNYPYAVVRAPRVSRTAHDSAIDSMRSSVGVDLGGQYEKDNGAKPSVAKKYELPPMDKVFY